MDGKAILILFVIAVLVAIGAPGRDNSEPVSPISPVSYVIYLPVIQKPHLSPRPTIPPTPIPGPTAGR